MKKKLVFLFILLVVAFSNVYAKGSCIYTYSDPEDSSKTVTLTVHETDSNFQDFGIDNNATDKYFVDYEQSSSFDIGKFNDNGAFSCATVYYLINPKAYNDKDVISFYSEPLDSSFKDPASLVKAGMLTGSFYEIEKESCPFNYKIGDKNIIYKISPGSNGYINAEIPNQYDNVEINYQSVRNLTEHFYSDGKFTCDDGDIGMISCDKGNTKFVYFGSHEYLDGLCKNQDGYTNRTMAGYDRPEEDSGENSGNSGNSGAQNNSGLVNLYCNSIFKDGEFGRILAEILDLIKFAVPIIIIGLSTIEFIKALAAQNQDEIKKATQKFIKRLIIGILIFAVPTILEYLLSIAGIEEGICNIR